ncbi:MAG: undecaprenyl-diphosphate phosphatase [Actinomycetota bacterium]|nr:undecaprenyl-diphosphate phosphatase [Actinomycetota bacterium]
MLGVAVLLAAQVLTGFRAAVLGVVQGLTEFIPVSSSAHLVLVPFLAGWPAPSFSFDVAVHFGTALGVVAYFARDLLRLLAGGVRWLIGSRDAEATAQARMIGLLALGSVPAAVAGFLLEDAFHRYFGTSEGVEDVGAPVSAAFLFGTAALLLAAERTIGRRPTDRPGRGIEDLTPIDALMVGVFQAFAIAPGISRSGSTISAAVFRGLSREAAARFSFLLSLPAILGAGILSLPDLPPGSDLGLVTLGVATAAVSGFLAIAFLLRYLRTRTMRPFAAYCVLFGAVSLAFWSQVR